MHLPSHQTFDVQSRIQFLEKLQRRAQRALLILEKYIPVGSKKDRIYHAWVYTSSLLRCVTGKWQKITQEEFHDVEFLHDKCLMKALLRNIKSGRMILLSVAKNGLAVSEWDAIWSDFYNQLCPSINQKHSLIDDFHELDRRK